jgi:hypothetical protein
VLHQRWSLPGFPIHLRLLYHASTVGAFWGSNGQQCGIWDHNPLHVCFRHLVALQE